MEIARKQTETGSAVGKSQQRWCFVGTKRRTEQIVYLYPTCGKSVVINEQEIESRLVMELFYGRHAYVTLTAICRRVDTVFSCSLLKKIQRFRYLQFYETA